jgi:hypothetical protein
MTKTTRQFETKIHPATRPRHSGEGGGFMPILIRAYRIPLADVIAPLMQSAFGSISSSLGTAAFAAGPRFQIAPVSSTTAYLPTSKSFG